MNFKEQVSKDIKDTFFNLDEFSEEHDINGETISCILDEDVAKERNINSETTNFEGSFVRQVSLFIKKEDIEKPSIGEQLHIDGFLYLVSNVSDSCGVFEIELTRNDY